MELEIFREKRRKLGDMKKRIDSRVGEWEQIKHDINPLELVYTFVKGESVSRIIPVSRAFFKMIELMDTIPNIPLRPIRTLHIAESPGGFIQAMNWKRRNHGILDYTMGWSLAKENVWRKLEDTSRTWSVKPVLKTADILKKADRIQIIENHHEEKAFLITGDGGFDFSGDYEHQEQSALPLILSQCVIALQCIEKDGVFILKIFDCFTLPTIQILWVLWKVFQGFRVIKPTTSRACNSEKYVVARGFRGMTDNLRNFLIRCEEILREQETDDMIAISTLFPEGRAATWDTMDSEFKTNFIQVIGGMIDTQTHWIEKGLDRFKISREEKILLAKEWCRKYRIPISHEYYEIHSLNETLGETDWQGNRRRFSLRRRLTSVSPQFCD